MRIANYIGFLEKSESNLAHALRAVAQGHAEEADIFHTCNKLAAKCDSHVEQLQVIADRYGKEAPPEADRLRLQVMDIARKGSLGLLRDLEDLYILVSACESAWVTLGQAAQAARDTDLINTVMHCTQESAQQRKWLQTRIKAAAAQTLVVGELAEAMARKAPWRQGLQERMADKFGAAGQALHLLVSAGATMVVVGLIAYFTKQPLLFASLGPSVYLFFEEPMSEKSTPRNTLVGHFVAIAIGYGCLFAFGLVDDRDVLAADATISRVIAAAVSVALTGAALTLLRASHPPAGATTLLVSLGFFNSLEELLMMAIGIITITLLGAGINRFLGASVPLWGQSRDRTKVTLRRPPAPDLLPSKGPKRGAA